MSEDKNTIVDCNEKQSGDKKKISMKPLLIGGALAIIAAVVAGFAIMSSMGKDDDYKPTAEDVKQIEYDSAKAERAQQRADQIHDEPFLMREENAQATATAPLLKGFTFSKEPEKPREIQKEGEAIDYILHSTPPPKTTEPQHTYSAPNNQANGTANGSNNNAANTQMFIYSRDFGGAKYVAKNEKPPEPPAAQPDEMTRALAGLLSAAEAETAKPDGAPNEQARMPEKTQLIYSGLTPVIVHEGEMLEAVLVNRLLVDVEPSPVICHLSRDLFDKSGQYVIFPANSRVIGASQAVTYKGASRLFISFHRIILPNGLSVDLPQSRKMMKAMDETGALGVVSHVNRHWMLQFGASIMLGVLDGVAGYAQRNNQTVTADGMVINRTSDNFDKVLDRVMSQYSSIVPTIRLDQGKTLRIYIADDMVVSPYARLADRSYYGTR